MTKKIIKNEYFVDGMHCNACELLIESELKDAPNVLSVRANLGEAKVYIESSKELNPHDLSKLVEYAGYKITKTKSEKDQNNNSGEIFQALLIAILVFGGFIALQKLGIVKLFGFEEVTLPAIFGIGVLASLSTCMAVVGGLVLSISSSYAKNTQTLPLFIFHISRLLGFFLLGGVIGILGSAFILTSTISVILNLLLFFVMVGIGLNLLEIPTLINKFQIKMPKFFGKYLLSFNKTPHRYTQNQKLILLPAILGVGTFFLPCGFTQSMQLFALTKGNFTDGAITMFAFSLGTLPVLAMISFVSNKYSTHTNKGIFFKSAGFIVIFFALLNLIGALSGAGIIPPILNF
ncbi:sulfite exporter TauE/SafE family protein [candidate division WWE3 bacterium]|nr:sulfite exporter TauE/SafE family protein [candidate division WWE3 bacterium]